MTSHNKDKKRNAMIKKIKTAEQARKDAFDAEVKQEIKRRKTPMKEAVISFIQDMLNEAKVTPPQHITKNEWEGKYGDKIKGVMKVKPINPVEGKPNWKKAQDIANKLKNPKPKKYKKPKHDPLEDAWKDVAKKKFEPKD